MIVLSNILAIDDKSASVSYHKSDISNKYLIKITIDELLEIFNENPTDIHKFDTSDCFTVIMKDGKEMSLTEYYPSKYYYPAQAGFFKISNKEMQETNNEIFISMNKRYEISLSEMTLMGKKSMLGFGWKIYSGIYDELANAKADLSGYDNCQKLLETDEMKQDNWSGMKFALSKNLRIGDYIYKGYIPSLGQLMILIKLIPLMNYLQGNKKEDFMSNSYWSSTNMHGLNNGYFWTLAGDKHMPDFAYKNKTFGVFPVFKKIYQPLNKK